MNVLTESGVFVQIKLLSDLAWRFTLRPQGSKHTVNTEVHIWCYHCTRRALLNRFVYKNKGRAVSKKERFKPF